MGEIKKSITIIGAKRKIRVLALIDSGATTSIIDYNLAKKLNLPSQGKRIGESINGATVEGVLTSARVKLNGAEIGVWFIMVKNIKEKVILGADFLQQHDIKINYAEEKITVPEIYKKRRFRL